jgi:hypothetical protein
MINILVKGNSLFDELQSINQPNQFMSHKEIAESVLSRLVSLNQKILQSKKLIEALESNMKKLIK